MGNEASWGTRWGRIQGVQPNRIVYNGEPAFKTDKQLGSRSVVCDTFDNASGANGIDYPSGLTGWPGMGWFAHKTGYNVLYGDGHTAWYDDSQKSQILWWLDVNTANEGLCASINVDFYASTDSSDGPIVQQHGSTLIWHKFDEAGGVDNGVDAANIGQ
jgi:prepilin-type processing-associated H-X9-DG protein